MAETRKIDIINNAFSLLRISGLTVGPSPFDLKLALGRLEDLANRYFALNLINTWNFEDNPDYNSFCWIPRAVNALMECGLAYDMCPDFGIMPSPSLTARLNGAMTTASAVISPQLIQEIPYPTRAALGSGLQRRLFPFIRYNYQYPMPPEQSATNNIYIGDENEYTTTWENWLRSGDYVASYDIGADPGMMLISSSLNAQKTTITYRIKAINQNKTGNLQQVKIVVTTAAGLINSRIISFNVETSTTVGGIVNPPPP